MKETLREIKGTFLLCMGIKERRVEFRIEGKLISNVIKKELTIHFI